MGFENTPLSIYRNAISELYGIRGRIWDLESELTNSSEKIKEVNFMKDFREQADRLHAIADTLEKGTR